jgi:type I restriction enzyme S subunit
MSKYPERPLADAIRLDVDQVSISENSTYEIAGVYSFGRGLFSRGPITGDQTSYKKMNRLHSGTVVLSRLKAFEGAISLVGNQFDKHFLSPEFPTFRVLTDNDVRYIGFLCQWPEFWGSLKVGSKGLGARRERVSVEHLLDIAVPLPDLVEQRRIADKLDIILGAADTVQKLRARVASLQASIAESLIETATTPARDAARVGEIVGLERAPISVEPDTVYRTVGVRSFGKGFIYHPPTRGEELSKLKFFKFRAGALALSNLMAWEGGITVTREEDTPYIASNRFFFYEPIDDRVNVSFLRHFLLSRRGQALIASACSSGAERNRTLGRSRFEALTIPLPPRAEQGRIARILDSLDERFRERQADPALDALRPSILNAAFTGQL